MSLVTSDLTSCIAHFKISILNEPNIIVYISKPCSTKMTIFQIRVQISNVSELTVFSTLKIENQTLFFLFSFFFDTFLYVV